MGGRVGAAGGVATGKPGLLPPVTGLNTPPPAALVKDSLLTAFFFIKTSKKKDKEAKNKLILPLKILTLSGKKFILNLR